MSKPVRIEPFHCPVPRLARHPPRKNASRVAPPPELRAVHSFRGGANKEAKSCFLIKDMAQFGKDRPMFNKGIGQFDDRIRASLGCGYIRAVFEIASIGQPGTKPSKLLDQVAKSREKVDGDLYDLITLLQKWRNESTLAKWLVKQRRNSDDGTSIRQPPKNAYGAAAEEDPADDVDDHDADGGDGN